MPTSSRVSCSFLLAAGFACLVGCSDSKSVDPDPGPPPARLDTIPGWILASDYHPDDDPLSPLRLTLVDGEFWGIDYGGAMIHGRPGSLEWTRHPAPAGDTLDWLLATGPKLYCGYYRRLYEFDKAQGTYREVALPESTGTRRIIQGIGSYRGRLVVSLEFSHGQYSWPNGYDIVWQTDTGWASLYANSETGLSSRFQAPHTFLEQESKLYAATSLDVGVLESPDSAWRRFPRKLYPGKSTPQDVLGTISDIGIWDDQLYIVNATNWVFVMDLAKQEWTDSLVAKRWYSPDTAPAVPEGFAVNYNIYSYRGKLYLCGGSWPGGLFSSGAWVWKPEVREWWHIPLLRQRGKYILTNGAQPMTELVFVGDTIYAASLDGVWKYPLDLVP